MNEPLHPQHSAPRTEHLSPVEAVDRFVQEISRPDFLTWEYGDWMRRVNVELSHLATLLEGHGDSVQSRIARMHDFIQLEPDWNLMNTLRRTLREAISLRQDLGATDLKTLADYGVSTTEQDPSFVTH